MPTARRDVLGLLLGMAGFALFCALIGASELANNTGDSWSGAFVKGLGAVLFLVVPFTALILLLMYRSRHDRWDPETRPQGAAPAPHGKKRVGEALFVLVFFVLVAAGPAWDNSDVTAGLAITVGGLAWLAFTRYSLRDPDFFMRMAESRARWPVMDRARIRKVGPEQWTRDFVRSQRAIAKYGFVPFGVLFTALGVTALVRGLLS